MSIQNKQSPSLVKEEDAFEVDKSMRSLSTSQPREQNRNLSRQN